MTTNEASIQAPPASVLLRHLPVSIGLIAPERIEELKAITPGLLLRLTDDDEWICEYRSSAREILFSVGTMTILWCFAHAYITLYDRVMPRWLAGEPEIDLTTPEEVASAMRLLSWALESWQSPKPDCRAWPKGTIRPIANPPLGSSENVADELALCAAAFLLHHELAHHTMKHTRRDKNVESVQQEQDADREAVSWILAKADSTSSFFNKRAYGIATAIGAMVALDIHSGDHGGRTHPRSIDRMVHAFDPYITARHHTVWQFIIVPMKLHLDARGIKPPAVAYESGRDCLEAYINLLAEKAEEG